MTPALRPARPGDADACAAILSDWIAATPWFPNLHGREKDRAFVAGKIRDAEVMVGESAGTVAGFSVLEEDYLACLYVRAPGQGLGRALLDAAKVARPGGFCLWTFQANTGARRFYAREGLVAERFTDGADNEEGLPDVLFRWHGGAAP